MCRRVGYENTNENESLLSIGLQPNWHIYVLWVCSCTLVGMSEHAARVRTTSHIFWNCDFAPQDTSDPSFLGAEISLLGICPGARSHRAATACNIEYTPSLRSYASPLRWLGSASWASNGQRGRVNIGRKNQPGTSGDGQLYAKVNPRQMTDFNMRRAGRAWCREYRRA